MKVLLDLDLCQGHGTCVEEAPEVFALDEKRSKAVVKTGSPEPGQYGAVRAAVRFCPTRALSIIEGEVTTSRNEEK